MKALNNIKNLAETLKFIYKEESGIKVIQWSLERILRQDYETLQKTWIKLERDRGFGKTASKIMTDGIEDIRRGWVKKKLSPLKLSMVTSNKRVVHEPEYMFIYESFHGENYCFGMNLDLKGAKNDFMR